MNVLTSGAKKPGLTLAPEAGTQRMRDIINKNVTEQQLLETVRVAFESGYRRIKLYFMIGLPYETDDDVVGIAELVKKVEETAREAVIPSQRGAIKVALSVSSFVPKAHTPFQWAAQDSVDELERKQQLLKQALPRKGVQYSYHDAHTSFLEGLIARGDRTLAPVIEAAWRYGARFEAYTELFDYKNWQQTFDECAFNPQIFTEAKSANESLPWDHIDIGVEKRYLEQEWDRARRAQLTDDCTFYGCTDCGICESLHVKPATEGFRRIKRSR
jgi:radical SAM superfamily enzyme YgiQ (UPF0313 family)